MIKKEDAKKMALKQGISDEVFETAWTSETEVDLEIPEIVVFTPTELTEHNDKLIAPIKTKHYEEGKVNGVEMEVKRVRETLGLDFEGKTIDNLVTAVKTKTLADAKIEPDAKVETLEKEKTLLQQTIDNLKTSHETAIGELNGKLTESSTNATIEAAIPDGAPEGLSKSDIRLMIRASYQFDTEDGKLVVKQNGEILKDEKQNPLSIETVAENFFEAKGWDGEGAPGGRNRKDEFGDGSGAVAELKRINNMADLEAYCKKHDLQPQSDEMLAMMEKHMTPEQRQKALRE